jgi:hypothetical protein
MLGEAQRRCASESAISEAGHNAVGASSGPCATSGALGDNEGPSTRAAELLEHGEHQPLVAITAMF